MLRRDASRAEDGDGGAADRGHRLEPAEELVRDRGGMTALVPLAVLEKPLV
jgi:hypothetical protein